MGRSFLDINWASTVINTLLAAFFVIAAGGIALGIYAARSLFKKEKQLPGYTPYKKVKKEKKKSAEAPVASASEK